MSSTDTQAHARCSLCAQVTWGIKEGFLGLLQIPHVRHVVGTPLRMTALSACI